MRPGLSFATIDGQAGFFALMAEGHPVLNAYLLVFSIAIPLIMALALAVSGKLSERVVQVVGLVGFAFPAFASLWLAAVYLGGNFNGLYAFSVVADLGLERFGIQLHLGLNGVALPFFVLAGVVGLAAGLYALQSDVERKRLYLILLLFMHGGLMGVFASVDLLFFYFFHEFALIPTFILIAIWGRPGRKAVAIEVTIYLTLGAMLTLAGLIALYVFSGAASFNMIEMRRAVIEAPLQGTLFGLLLIGFGILVSLFPFHSWAPRAYATAPAPAAMLHAGVLKKFGLYGLIQIAYPMLPHGAVSWAPLLLWLALGNLVIIGFVTMAQRDLKSMLGTASVMHMGYAFLGLYAFSSLGTGAAILMLFAHGLSVALLFLLADVVERRTGTVDMEDIGGLGQRAPVLMGLFVAATMASIGLPGFANFWGELGIFLSLFASETPWALYIALIGILISAIYGLRAVARVFFGETKGDFEGGDIRTAEKLPAVLLLLALFLIGIWPKLLSDPVDASVSRIYSNALTTETSTSSLTLTE
jgi:NADH-quinone oxidoreductase subunit M